jgi:2-dehydro-3-deoxygluconokinase
MVLFLAEQAGPLRESETFRRHIAGAESNVAIGVCRLGGSATWISRLGNDELGRAILFRLRGEGVDTSHVVWDAAHRTGVMVREQRAVGPLEVLYYRHHSAASCLSPADIVAAEATIQAAGFLHVTGITPALSESARQATFAAVETARAAGVPVVLDPNIRWKLWGRAEAKRVLCDLAARCDVVLPGADEAEVLTGEAEPEPAARRLLESGPRLVVVKLGAAGALAVAADGTSLRIPAYPIARVVDPVGAGDAFAAGFLIGNVRKLALHEALTLAARCGALAVTSPGDVEGFPRWADVADSASDVRR